MKCINCLAEIPPAWVACLQSNSCPGCGKEIMDEPTKTLLTELKEAMLKMPNDAEGLAGWLVSNYHLQKVGDGEPTTFHRAQDKTAIKAPPKSVLRKSKTESGELEDLVDPTVGEKLTSDEDVAIFAKRAGIGNLAKENKKKNLASLAAQIKNAGGISPENSLDMDNIEDADYQISDGLDVEPDIDPQHEALINGALSGQMVHDSSSANDFQKLKALSARNKMTSGQGGFSRR